MAKQCLPVELILYITYFFSGSRVEMLASPLAFTGRNVGGADKILRGSKCWIRIFCQNSGGSDSDRARIVIGYTYLKLKRIKK